MQRQKRISKLLTVFVMCCAFLFTAHTFAQKVVEMTGTNQMRFSVEQITVQAGETVTIKLTTKSKLPAIAMSHNFVLLKKSADVKAFAMTSASHKDNGYIDPAKEELIIAQTDMAGGGETVTVTFTAPKEPGDYPYVCTFPGHYVSGMKGVLTVK